MRLKLFITCAVLGTIMSSAAVAQQTAKITSSNTAYLEYLPQGYNSNSNLYPLVISLHGIKEKGTTSTDPATLKSSVLRVANVGLPKYVKYGAQYPFILISPQLKTSYGSWPAAYVLDVINYVKKNLRVDPRRVYITGLSLGGKGVWTTLGAYPEVFAGALPICAGGNSLNQACAIAAENVPVWGFHGDADNIVSYTVTTKMVAAINACTPKPSPLAKATLFAGAGHVIWDKVYNQTNALDWMLSYTNGTVSSTNLAPQVDAGVDVTEYLPTNVAVCNGSAVDPDGSVKSYAWSQVSGPSSATLENKATKSLKASNLKAGTYTFRLKAVDDKGAYSSDDVKVIINSTTSTAPTVSAGSDKTVTLPANSLYIQGTASDSDGIASYQWTKVSGGAASLGGQTTSQLRAYNLLAGTYVFRLTVKDTKGSSKYDDVMVTVLNATASTANLAPVANAGADKTVTLPATSVKLYGSAKDSDGTIASYKWTQYSGTATATISYSTSATATISNLKEGKYYFRLTVKDNAGASDYDNVLVKVVNGTVSVLSLEDSIDTMLALAD
jgi:poly(3-hydroxybutyrate) depolymerase